MRVVAAEGMWRVWRLLRAEGVRLAWLAACARPAAVSVCMCGARVSVEGRRGASRGVEGRHDSRRVGVGPWPWPRRRGEWLVVVSAVSSGDEKGLCMAFAWTCEGGRAPFHTAHAHVLVLRFHTAHAHVLVLRGAARVEHGPACGGDHESDAHEHACWLRRRRRATCDAPSDV